MHLVTGPWSVLPDKRHWQRWQVHSGDLVFGTAKKSHARAIKRIVGGRIIRVEPTIEYESRLVLLKLWGPDPEESRRSVLLHSFWLHMTEARHMAFKWELASSRNQAAWLHGRYVLAGEVLARPFSAKDVPF